MKRLPGLVDLGPKDLMILWRNRSRCGRSVHKSIMGTMEVIREVWFESQFAMICTSRMEPTFTVDLKYLGNHMYLIH